MQKVSVVNVKTTDTTFEYIGRGNRKYQRSALANPFRLAKGDEPGSTLERYRSWLWEKMVEDDESVMVEIERLIRVGTHTDMNLGCYCAPGPCHGDVLASMFSWLGGCKSMSAVKAKIKKHNGS